MEFRMDQWAWLILRPKYLEALVAKKEVLHVPSFMVDLTGEDLNRHEVILYCWVKSENLGIGIPMHLPGYWSGRCELSIARSLPICIHFS